MKTYWKGTDISVSRLRLWLSNVIIPKRVRGIWDEQNYRQIIALDEARREAFEAKTESQQRDSLHERNWLRQASAFSGIDLSYDASLYIRREYENHALLVAKEAYKMGMGYREFLPFYKLYRGVG